ncbi:MAG: Nif3-like dinuclear metal center hexameric protein [Thiohalocapsa sp.]|nr:Nif3-like dinuclear metal center hexameric protein [Thiohalocapsa sp.]MCF7990589.1 Nif3-like dinuclear metal center hexameric protein [Thiohalocapsa sp.]
MIDADTLGHHCDALLSASDFDDYCPNGLQVAGERHIRHLVSGVTASQALIDAAIAADADALLVHHGFFWKGEDPRLVGMKGRRISALMRAGISLLAYHLPLDAHPELGNNRRLAEVLRIGAARPVGEGTLIWVGELQEPLPGAAFAEHVGKRLERAPLHVAALERPVRSIAWCTGGAQGYIETAASLGADVYISGEVSEQTVHQARELGIDYIAAGHHATERYGVQALGTSLAETFGISHRFIDIHNPA